MARIPCVVGSVIEDKSRGGRNVDRKKVCPHLIRIFFNLSGRHNSLGDYLRGNFPENELQIHTWMDANLMDLTKLIQESCPDARRRGTYFNFSVVFLDARGKGYRMKDVGLTCSGQRGPDDLKTLFACRFQIGDYLDVSISPPPQRSEASTSRRGGRF